MKAKNFIVLLTSKTMKTGRIKTKKFFRKWIFHLTSLTEKFAADFTPKWFYAAERKAGPQQIGFKWYKH